MNTGILKELERVYKELPLYTMYSSLSEIYDGLKPAHSLIIKMKSNREWTPLFEEGEERKQQQYLLGLKEVKKKIKYDGVHYGLRGYECCGDEEVFHVQPVRYSIFCATNRNKDFLNISRDAFNPFVYTDLANSLGSNAGLILKTPEGEFYTLIGKRSDELTVYPGLYGTPAGMCNYGLSFLENILKEIKEEIESSEDGLNIKRYVMAKATYLGRNMDDLHPEIIFMFVCEVNDDNPLRILKTNWEYKNKRINAVRIGSDEHLGYLMTFIDDIPKGVIERENIEKYWKIGETPAWVQAQWVASALTIFYYFDKLNSSK